MLGPSKMQEYEYAGPTWYDVASTLEYMPHGARLIVRKERIAHHGGFMKRSLGIGMARHYRMALERGCGLHVKEYPTYYACHIDNVYPTSKTVIRHMLRDVVFPPLRKARRY